VSPQPFDSVKGFGVTFKQIFKKPITHPSETTGRSVGRKETTP
jgi:hypothetical protein